MDLTTLLKRIPEFEMLETALDAFRQIWRNCLQFNVEGSDIYLTAIDLALKLEKIVEDKFGERFVSYEWNKKVVKLPEIRTLSQSDMKMLLDRICDNDLSVEFLHPVKESDAPGYRTVVKTPMDLTTIRKKLKSGSYLNDENSFIHDIRLIWKNCAIYNDSNSRIVENARKLSSFFENELKKVGRSPSVSEAATVQAFPPSRKKVITFMENFLDSLKEFPYITPFINPVDEKLAPGYYEIVKHPMCLSQIEQNLSRYLDQASFLEDVRLIWGNCKLYNEPGSEIYEWAVKCEEFFDNLLPTAEKKKHKAEKKSDDVKISEDSNGDGEENGRPKSRAKISWQERKYRSILHKLSIDDELQPLFFYGEKAHPCACIDYNHIRDDLKSLLGNPTEYHQYMINVFASLVKSSPENEKLLTKARLKFDSFFVEAYPNLGSIELLPNPEVSTVSETVSVQSMSIESLKDELRALLSFNEPGIVSEDYTDESVVEDRILKNAANLLRNTKLPFSSQGPIQVDCFGELFARDLFHSENHLYPVGYSASVSLRLCFSQSQQFFPLPYIPVGFVSKIIRDEGENKPAFLLLLENGVEVTRGASPLDAWKGLQGKEENILLSLSSKLKRCRAVFNRLCISPDAVPFLEQIPVDSDIGEDYYRVIKSPMWLREIHSRLVEGNYDNEYDFAWDMRLTFRNCKEYNTTGSLLDLAARRLETLFHILFTEWVLNVHDISVEDRADGIWGEWYYLKYFDEVDPSENFCRISRQKGRPGEFYKCKWCEDQYLPRHVEGAPSKILKNWVCKRCSKALELAGGDLKNEPFVKEPPQSRYTSSSVGRNCWVLAPEIGDGWCQAKRKGRSGLKNIFLSPLGYEIFSKEDIEAQKDFEAAIDMELMSARCAEFQDSLPGKKGRKKPRSKNQKSGTEVVIPDEISPFFAPHHLEEGRIITGKLCDYTLPPNLQFSWCLVHGDDYSIVNFSELPETGYFGLETEDIRSRLEGLPNVKLCREYKFLNSESLKSDIMAELESRKYEQEVLSSAATSIFELLICERWRFEKERAYCSVPQTFVDPIESLPGVKPINFSDITTDMLDSLFSLWEFVGSASASFFLGDLQVSFHELVCCLQPPVSILHSPNQVVFDELGSSITDFLLYSLKYVLHLEEKEWEEFLYLHPVNIVTWPKIAEFCLILSSLPLTADQFRIVLNTNLSRSEWLHLKTLATIFCHPLFDQFEGWGSCKSSVTEIIEKIINSNIEETTNLGNDEFARLLSDALVTDTSDVEILTELRKWVEGFLIRSGIVPGIEVTSHLPTDISRPCHARDWGGFVCRNSFVEPLEDVLLPWSFDLPKNPLVFKWKAMGWLEKSFSLLTTSDSETWSAHDRLAVLLCLADYARGSKQYREWIVRTSFEKSQTFTTISVPDCVPLKDDLRPASSLSKDTKCSFTGIKFSSIPDIDKWVLVPSDLSSCLESKNDSESLYSLRNQKFALKSVAQKLLGCRQRALEGNARYQVLIQLRLLFFFLFIFAIGKC